MNPRREIYYWKCDRPAAFHGTIKPQADAANDIIEPLKAALRRRFPGRHIEIKPGGGQGNHRTFLLDLDEENAFVRVEDGPEGDDYFDVEAVVFEVVRPLGVPVPRHLGSDTGRKDTPFSWQILERIPSPDLNFHLQQGTLPLQAVAKKIGALVGAWQEIQPSGFGPFDAAVARESGVLDGFHRNYGDYFHLNLDRHVQFLVDHQFLSSALGTDILQAIAARADLLQITRGCLVHKDLALWNLLGTPQEILSVIDWDDAIAGDPMDDLSLLGCFYDGQIIQHAFDGYISVRPLPGSHQTRFWLHLLRNMLVKACIRVGAGYFYRPSGFFLIGKNGTGHDLKTFTFNRLVDALEGLKNNHDPRDL